MHASSSSPEEVLILGAGPAGMAAAMELSKAGKPATVVEKDRVVGGLAQTLSFQEPEGEYRTDIGPHRFFSKNKYLYEFIEDLLHEEWKKVPRLTRFFVDGKFYFYPIRFGNVLTQIGFLRAVRMMLDYLWERVRALVSPRPLRSFEDYVLTQFGRTLANFNMLNYTEKIWGSPCSQISIDWATQRIGGLSLWATLQKAIFGKKSNGPKSLIDTFYYPSHGSGLIYEAIRKRIESQGSTILTHSEPTSISWENGRITSVDVRTPEGARTITPRWVVSSIPITRAIELFNPPAPQEVLNAMKSLRFRAQVYLFLTVNKESITKDNWVYFPDKDIIFGRISEMKNFSKDMCPPGKTSLFIEFFCFKDDAVWNASKEELYEKAMNVLEKLQFLKRSEVLNVHHFRREHVYPLYDLTYSERLQVVLDWLDGLQNFHAIGRPGRFRYTNQDHSLEMGIDAARAILSGKTFNTAIGMEQEYFEQGDVPTDE